MSLGSLKPRRGGRTEQQQAYSAQLTDWRPFGTQLWGRSFPGPAGLVVTHIFVCFRAQRAQIRKPGAERSAAPGMVVSYAQAPTGRNMSYRRLLRPCQRQASLWGLGSPQGPRPWATRGYASLCPGFRIQARWARIRTKMWVTTRPRAPSPDTQPTQNAVTHCRTIASVTVK